MIKIVNKKKYDKLVSASERLKTLGFLIDELKAVSDSSGNSLPNYENPPHPPLKRPEFPERPKNRIVRNDKPNPVEKRTDRKPPPPVAPSSRAIKEVKTTTDGEGNYTIHINDIEERSEYPTEDVCITDHGGTKRLYVKENKGNAKEETEYSDLLNEMKYIYNKFMYEADKVKKKRRKKGEKPQPPQPPQPPISRTIKER